MQSQNAKNIRINHQFHKPFLPYTPGTQPIGQSSHALIVFPALHAHLFFALVAKKFLFWSCVVNLAGYVQVLECTTNIHIPFI